MTFNVNLLFKDCSGFHNNPEVSVDYRLRINIIKPKVIEHCTVIGSRFRFDIMNAFIGFFGLCLLLTVSDSRPLDGVLEDSELVGSNLNKVYAQAPFEDLQSAGTGHKGQDGHKGQHDDDDSGYYRSKSTKGDNGYKHFDSYHKKGGDKYGYEKHTAFGKGTGGKDGGSHYTSGKYHEVDGDEGGSHGEYQDGEGEFKKISKL